MVNFAKARALGLLAATSAVAILAGSSTAGAQTTLIMDFYLPRSTPFWVDLMKPWADEVEKRTDGRVKVTVPSAPLGSPDRQWDIVTRGVADVVMMSFSFQRQHIKLPVLTSIPLTAETAEGASIALWRTYAKYFAPAGEYKGTKVITMWAIDADTLQSAKGPILKLEDLKGMKMLSSPAIQKDIVTALGATPVIAPVTQAFELMSGGVVDGNIQVASAPTPMKYDQYLKHVTVFPGGLGRTGFAMVINRKSWDKIAPGDQKIIDGLGGEEPARKTGRAFDAYVNAGIGTMKGKGVQMHVADAAFVKAIAPRLEFIEKDWLKDAQERKIDGPAALAFFKATAKTVTAEKR